MLIFKYSIVNFTPSTFVYAFIHLSMRIWTVLRSHKFPRLLLPFRTLHWPYSWYYLIVCGDSNKWHLTVGFGEYLSAWLFWVNLIVRSSRMDYFVVDSKLYLLYFIDGLWGLGFDSKLGWFFKLANFGWFSFFIIWIFSLLFYKNLIETFNTLNFEIIITLSCFSSKKVE